MRSYNSPLRSSVPVAAQNTRCSVYGTAQLLRVQNKPVAPVEDYDTWLASAVSGDKRGRCSVDGRILRRAVQMVRNGSSITQAARDLNRGHVALHKWMAMLPEELRP